MERRQIILFIVFLILPAAGFPAVFAYLRSRHFGRKLPPVLYQFCFLRHTSFLSNHTLIQIAVLMVLYAWLAAVFPSVLTVIVLAIACVGIQLTKAKQVDFQALSDSSENLLQRLSAMQIEIGDIRQHIEGLSCHIISKQIELDEKEELRCKLEKEIKAKATEAEFWSDLTEDEKQAILAGTVSAISKNSRSNFWMGILLGFFINLLATLTWTLLGNPGKDQIIRKLQRFGEWFK